MKHLKKEKMMKGGKMPKGMMGMKMEKRKPKMMPGGGKMPKMMPGGGKMPKNKMPMYAYGGKVFAEKGAMLKAILKDPDQRAMAMRELKMR